MNPWHSYAIADHKYKLFPTHSGFCKKSAFYLNEYSYNPKLRESNPFQMQKFLGIQTTIAKARNKIEEALVNLWYHNCI